MFRFYFTNKANRILRLPQDQYSTVLPSLYTLQWSDVGGTAEGGKGRQRRERNISAEAILSYLSCLCLVLAPSTGSRGSPACVYAWSAQCACRLLTTVMDLPGAMALLIEEKLELNLASDTAMGSAEGCRQGAVSHLCQLERAADEHCWQLRGNCSACAAGSMSRCRGRYG